MNELTLVIPAKEEAESLPLVLDEIKGLNLKVIIVLADDDLKTILKRYDTYMKTTKPVLDFYSKNTNFYDIDGTLEIDEITMKIDGFLNV